MKITYESIIESKGRYWLAEGELNPMPEIIECEGEFWDVIGYSKARKAYLICPIHIYGAAEHIEEEIE